MSITSIKSGENLKYLTGTELDHKGLTIADSPEKAYEFNWGNYTLNRPRHFKGNSLFR